MRFIKYIFEKKITKNREIIFLIGLPASGKSTFINKLIGYDVISNDHVVEDFAVKNNITYTEAFEQLDREIVLTSVRMKYKKSVKNNNNIIIDNTNMTQSERGYFISNIPSNYKKIAIIFKVSDSVLKRRLKKRGDLTGKIIPYEVIEKMKKKYEKPTKGEFDEIKTISN